MDVSKLERLRMAHIETPCPEDWDKMTGDEQKRHCAGCGCSVHNIADMSAKDAEQLLATPEQVCVRLTFDDSQNLLTRDGWVPRMLLAGAVAATVAGCGHKDAKLDLAETTKSVAATTTSSPGPSPFEVLEEKLEELIDEIKEAIVPGSTKHYMVMGAMAAPTISKASRGP